MSRLVVIGGIDHAIATGGTGVVLHLLQHDQIRRVQVGDDDRGQPGEGVIGRIGATSVGSRFSTLKVATASSSVPAGSRDLRVSVEGAG